MHQLSSSVEESRDFAVDGINELLAAIAAGAPPADLWAQVRAAIEALPLPSGEAAAAFNRLASARRYVQSGEAGASLFELRLLARSLNRP